MQGFSVADFLEAIQRAQDKQNSQKDETMEEAPEGAPWL